MVTLLQAYWQVSDAEAVELSVRDRRWQVVLDGLEATEPRCSQGAVGEVRVRLICPERDRRRRERTGAIARQSTAFDPRQLPQTLRVAFAARALEGAGRVEDTIKLLGPAARNGVQCGAMWLGCTAEAVARQAGMLVL
jgi:hypothetical protein